MSGARPAGRVGRGYRGNQTEQPADHQLEPE